MDTQDWAPLVEAATRAPSIHNTQPWTFSWSPDRVEVFLDRARSLPAVDPTGRQQVVSCGSAVEFLVVALRAAGWSPQVALLPDRERPDLLAVVSVAGRHEVTAEDRALVDAIDRRHTERAPFLPRVVPAELVDRWQAAGEELGVWVEPIVGEDAELATVSLLARAEDVEEHDPAYLAELQRWLRTDQDAPDGVPVAAVPGADPAGRASNWVVRDFLAGRRTDDQPAQPGSTDAPPPVVERPTVLLLGTVGDDRVAWVQAGRALGRLLLLATSVGVAASPLTQALDWPGTRVGLGVRLSLVGHPQMLLRMGYPATPGSPTGRRPVGEVLRESGGPAPVEG